MSRFRRRILGGVPWPPLKDLARPLERSLGDKEPIGGELFSTGLVGGDPVYGASRRKESLSIFGKFKKRSNQEK
jgi:hypothetical protein